MPTDDAVLYVYQNVGRLPTSPDTAVLYVYQNIGFTESISVIGRVKGFVTPQLIAFLYVYANLGPEFIESLEGVPYVYQNILVYEYPAGSDRTLEDGTTRHTEDGSTRTVE